MIFFFWIEDLNLIWEDLLVGTGSNLKTLHDLDLDTEHTRAEFSITNGSVDEVVLGLTSRDLITSRVLLCLCTLATDFTGDNDFATNGTSTANDCSKNVVGGKTNWDSG